ncbi:MAG: metallophosphoesterase, partial [Pirellulales bacterium]
MQSYWTVVGIDMNKKKWARAALIGLVGMGGAVSHLHDAWSEPLTFAVIGDFGSGDPTTAGRVAEMIGSPAWGTDFVVTTGDNNYGLIDVGAAGDWDAAVGQFYGDYTQARSDGAYPNQTGSTQRFFPTIGNHDSTETGTGQTGRTGGINPGFVDYFQTDPARPDGRLPAGVIENDQVYYDFQQGDARFFVLDSDHARVDPNLLETEKTWLREGLENSTATWNFVTLHHSPYSSSAVHGNNGFMQWPFAEWGVDAVFGGHDHTYERNVRLGVPYFVSGLGGKTAYAFGAPNFFSEVRYNEQFGAMRVTVDAETATFDFLSIDDGAEGANGGQLVDRFRIDKSEPRPEPTVLLPRGSTWSYLDNGSDLGTDWKGVGFPPSSTWAFGSAELGYGDGDETTTVGCGPSAPACDAGNFATTYFRTTFQVDPTSLEGVGRILLEMVHDDGAAVYLNGTEVARNRLADGAAFDEFATRSVSGDKRETEFVPFAIDPALLVPGENVLAVEIHQASANSSDVSFDLQLTTDFAPLPPPALTLLP